ncbi:hypothetical protein V8E52_006792 [Russula decolorans]
MADEMTYISANTVWATERIRLKRSGSIQGRHTHLPSKNVTPPREQTPVSGIVTWLSDTCEKHGKGDGLCAYINWGLGLVVIARRGRQRRKERNGEKGEAETAEFVPPAHRATPIMLEKFELELAQDEREPEGKALPMEHMGGLEGGPFQMQVPGVERGKGTGAKGRTGTGGGKGTGAEGHAGTGEGKGTGAKGRADTEVVT